MRFFFTFIAFLSISLSGCIKNSDHELIWKPDPLEKFNRKMFDLNYKILDPYLLRPIAIAWRDYIPMTTRNILNNFTSNLEEPASIVNTLLKGNPYYSIIHFNRFFLNVLCGIGGLIDVASMANSMLIREKSNRFGSTLGYYNIGYGPYIMLPGYGSFTLREDGGDLVDTFYPVLSYLIFWMSLSKWMIEKIESRTQFLDSDQLLYNSSDPYMIIYTAYFQHHNFIANNNALNSKENLNKTIIQSYLDEID